MDLVNGQVVISLTGRDKGRYMAVIRQEPGFAYVADGKTRHISQPKKKNIKHLAATKTNVDIEKIENDKSLREAIIEAFGSDGR